MSFRPTVKPTGDLNAALRTLQQDAERRMEAAALAATKAAGRQALNGIRSEMRSRNLGRLPNALGMTSDADKGTVHRKPTGFRASGVVFAKGKSARTHGAIESYTVGATISPRQGRWLWIPTKEIQRLTGTGRARVRVTPGNWTQFGLDRKVGPLVPLKGINGRPLLAVENVGTGGRAGTARSLTKKGRARKGQRRREIVIAFVAIPRTSRAARVNIDTHMNAAQSQLQALFDRELERNA